MLRLARCASYLTKDPLDAAVAHRRGDLVRAAFIGYNGYNYTGILPLNCTPASTPPLPCLPAFVTMNNGSGTGKVIVGTSNQTRAGTYFFSITGADGNGLTPSNGAQSLALVVP
jgi:hypothetical protein